METKSLFPQKAPFKEAFPQIENLKVKVEESGEGIHESSNPRYYDEKVAGQYIDCSNPLCDRGGFSIGKILHEMVNKKETHNETSASCQGNEGSPEGKRIYRKCFNHFKVTVDIKYQEQKEEEPGS